MDHGHLTDDRQLNKNPNDNREEYQKKKNAHRFRFHIFLMKIAIVSGQTCKTSKNSIVTNDLTWPKKSISKK